LIRAAVRRGWQKRCPHCGRGPLYNGWIDLFDRCSVCGLVYERNRGDAWMFVNVADRLFIAALLAVVFFGTHRTHPRLTVLVFLVVGAVLVWTTPNRWGVCTALHYLVRVYAPDPDDPIPS
jgi:uncharacterized protein (DUF983 family)